MRQIPAKDTIHLLGGPSSGLMGRIPVLPGRSNWRYHQKGEGNAC